MNPQETFLNILIAAMKDAVESGELTQIKTTMLNEKTGKVEYVRMVIMPEVMQHNWPKYAPAGTPTKGN